ncbi:MAG TPA: glycosyltransferase family 39 protein [Streptosporangiaceae bacterium]
MEDGSALPRTSDTGLVDFPAAGSGSHRQARSGQRQVPAWLPLVAVLAVQTLLTVRLLRADTAFQDEALYLWAGHREIAHLLHGTPIPPFASYFSGAPVLYPVLGAMADSVGGLAGARILSLIFMLGATALLWSVARRLYGPVAAFFAAALFAVLGPTLHLGAFATFDAMALFLVALATWCVVRAGDRRDATAWMVTAGIVLAVANATAYASTIYDVVVILLALTLAYPAPGGKQAVSRCFTLLTVLVVLIGLGILIGGSYYESGIAQTTIARVPGAASPLTVLGDAWLWTGLAILLALAAVAFSLITREGWARTLPLAVFAAAAMVGPLEQAHLHTAASLNKHVGHGVWFAAIAAGYAVDRLVMAAPAGRSRAVTCGACVVALVFPATLGISQSKTFSSDWPNASAFIAILRPYVGHGHGRVLVEDPSIAEYYLGTAGADWKRWSSTRNIVLPSGKNTGGPSTSAGVTGPGNKGVFEEFILQRYFSVIALNFQDTSTLDKQLNRELKHDKKHYRIVQVVPYGPWPGTYIIFQRRRPG